METWLVQLADTRTLVGFALGVVAAAIAIGLQAGVEYRHWLRQQRLEAFATFLGGLDSIVRPAMRWRHSWDKAEENTEREHFFDEMEALDRSGGRIHLLSGPTVNRAAIQALRQWTIEINTALKGHDEPRFERTLDTIGAAYRVFAESARVELGQPKAFLGPRDFAELGADRARLKDAEK